MIKMDVTRLFTKPPTNTIIISYDDHGGHHGHRPRSYCGIPAARGKSKGVRRSVGPAAVATLLVPAHCIVATLPTSTSLGWN